MSKRKFPPDFWRMCAGALLFFLSFNLVLPELPDTLRSLGGGDYLGWIIPAFALSALLARPVSGYVTDVLGRKTAMIGGSVFCVVAGLLYPVAGSIAVFFFIRLVHGFSTGFSPTGFTAFTTDIVPEGRRGEALGWQGIFSNLGSSAGYALGSMIVIWLGRNGMFVTSSLMAVAAILIFLSLKETKPVHTDTRIRGIWYPKAWPPALGMLLVCIPLGAILTIMPDYTVSKGFANKGLYLSVYIAASLAVRIFSGKLSDRIGRPISLATGSAFQCIGLTLLAFDYSFFLSAIFYGVGQGFNAPALFAWAGDLSSETNRGRTLSMLFVALEAGVIIGGLGAGYGSSIFGAGAEHFIFAICSIVVFGSFVFGLYSHNKKKAAPEERQPAEFMDELL